MKPIMKILLLYPEIPDTFWSFKYALKFVFRKSSFPPLGLLTVASMLPSIWEVRLVDMNVERLKDKDLAWADYVFISAMSIQSKSVDMILAKCRTAGVQTVAGGPLFTEWHDRYTHIDHLVLKEAELTLPAFLRDLESGSPRHIYTTEEWADLKTTPIPRWNLINIRKYASMNIQYSRGCPFNCEFCDIVSLYGHTPRLKGADQVIAELQALYDTGWRGNTFFVDDNFIGNKQVLKTDILPAVIGWMKARSYPFMFCTEASVNLSDDDELIRLMVEAGFNMVFVGIESPNEASLSECGKHQNKNRNLISCIKKLHHAGLQVQGGFIVGFDSDPESIFKTLVDFIQESGVVTAMVGLLSAMRGTRLYRRLLGEGRITDKATGDNTDFTMNFIPRMDYDTLLDGYRSIITDIYSPRNYYARVRQFLTDYSLKTKYAEPITFRNIYAFLKSIFHLGFWGKDRMEYWRLLFWTLSRHPRLFPMAVSFAIYGYHFRKVYACQVSFDASENADENAEGAKSNAVNNKTFTNPPPIKQS